VNSVLPGPTRSRGLTHFVEVEVLAKEEGKSSAEFEADFFQKMPDFLDQAPRDTRRSGLSGSLRGEPARLRHDGGGATSGRGCRKERVLASAVATTQHAPGMAHRPPHEHSLKSLEDTPPTPEFKSWVQPARAESRTTAEGPWTPEFTGLPSAEGGIRVEIRELLLDTGRSLGRCLQRRLRIWLSFCLAWMYCNRETIAVASSAEG
jgi:hypothetical protein